MYLLLFMVSLAASLPREADQYQMGDSKAQDVIIISPKSIENVKVGFIFAVGTENFKLTDYNPLINTLQAQGQNRGVSAIVGLVSDHSGFQLPFGSKYSAFTKRVWSSYKKMLHQMDGLDEVVLVAHSSAAYTVQDWLMHCKVGSIDVPPIKKVVLLGAVTTPEFKNYTIVHGDHDVLVVGGDLDGVTRVFKYAEDLYYEATTRSTKFKVLVLPGVSHRSFASLNAGSALIQKADFTPLQKDNKVYKDTADLMYALLSNNSENDQQLLNMHHDVTSRILSPIIDSLLLEASYSLHRPCSDFNDAKPETVEDACWLSSPWAMFVQKHMVGDDENDMGSLIARNVNIISRNEIHKSWVHFPLHFPDVRTRCRHPDDQCLLLVNSVSENKYESSKDALLQAPVSASEIKAKLLSREAAHRAAGNKTANYEYLDSDDKMRCAKMNLYSWNWALKRIGLIAVEENDRTWSETEKILNDLYRTEGLPLVRNAGSEDERKFTEPMAMRFQSFGVPLGFNTEDQVILNGARWIWTDLNYDAAQQSGSGEKPDRFEVKSPTMTFPVDFFIKAAGGIHFCKLLSPARALEWIYTDGLRL